MKVTLYLGLLAFVGLLQSGETITFYDLYQPGANDVEVKLPLGDYNYKTVQLTVPVHFYSELYEEVFVNDNGILTFGIEFPTFANRPFPLEFPSIAPFYANVDTTGANETTSISYFLSTDMELLGTVTALVQREFVDELAFDAKQVLIATWQNVGRYNANNDLQNTFQVAVICGADKTFVQFLYPEGGLNWMQGNDGDSGLPDVRGQAGFVSEDGRYLTLQGSAKEQIKFLPQRSNYGVPGSWIYCVTTETVDENVAEPEHIPHEDDQYYLESCDTSGNSRCHSAAKCVDKEVGYCCVCHSGYYGNGYNCVKKDGAIRVAGKISGRLGDQTVSTQLQAYMLITDGRSYTAISPLTDDLGFQLQLIPVLAGPIGWMFAKPSGEMDNGYQITGGIFNHTATVSFEESGTQLTIVQRFIGLDVWDQLSVEIELNGDLPRVTDGSRIIFPDVTEAYSYNSDTSLQTSGEYQVSIDGRDTKYRVDQEITFEKCKYSVAENFHEIPTFYNRVTRISSAYHSNETALRIGMLNKLVLNQESNPCTDGTAVCGENTVCVLVQDDLYDCNCINGYTRSAFESSIENCVDIDECSGNHICHENAECTNQPGGYTCRCISGFSGNGYQCQSNEQQPNGHYSQPDQAQTINLNNRYPEDQREYGGEIQEGEENIEDHREQYQPQDAHNEQQGSEYQYREHENEDQGGEYQPQESVNERQDGEENRDGYGGRNDAEASPSPDVPSLAPDHWLCDQCSQHAECTRGICTCLPGYRGDGTVCESVCPEGDSWSVDQCQPTYSSIGDDEEEELAPFCHQQGCSCADGYELIEYAIKQICRKIHRVEGTHDSDEENEKLPCDLDYNCSPDASCEWSENEQIHKCFCKDGYEGDGFKCTELEVSCVTESICDVHATCLYDETVGKSVCKCDKGYEGDGKFCQLAPECLQSEDCGQNTFCDAGVCVCQDGFERDTGDFCVPAGSCGGAYCAENAKCTWDHVERISYCLCPAGFVGDGVKSCKSIPPPCNVRNNCGLNAACAQNYRDPAIYECVCNVGYYGDGLVCMQQVNCVNVPTLCHPNAQCASTTSGLQCVCNNGFIGNGSYCAEPPRYESGFLLLSQGVATIRVPFNGKRGRPVGMSQMAIGLDKDCSKGRVYWSDISAKHIMSIKYDGTDRQPFITEDIVSPEGIAIDWISRRLYWTDSSKDTIEVADLDNPKARIVIVRKHLVNPRGIAVDPRQNKVFWSDWNRDGPKIEWANLDGTQREILIADPSVKLPNSLAISQNTGELCFADAGTKKVECIDTYSKMVRTVASNLTYPFGLTVTNDHYYWTDWTTKKIEVVDGVGNRLPGISSPLLGNHKMYGMCSVTEDCPLFFSPCQINNGDCPADRLCLVNPLAPSGRSCQCIDANTQCNEVLPE